MEYVWYAIASLGAGIGTGLTGLSAATVMVPILIVLCPSFSGETGAYQATAIALASDIIGSAVTAYTYAKQDFRIPACHLCGHSADTLNPLQSKYGRHDPTSCK